MRTAKKGVIPRKSEAPHPSLIETYLPGANFHDAWSITVNDSAQTAFGWYLAIFTATPRWLNRLMSMRNRAARWFGLKDLGSFSDISRLRPEGDYRPGDRMGIFTFVEAHSSEVLLCDDDKHLAVSLSVHRSEIIAGCRVITVTTVVHGKNVLGGLYMIPVTPMHRLIVPRSLSALGRSGDA